MLPTKPLVSYSDPSSGEESDKEASLVPGNVSLKEPNPQGSNVDSPSSVSSGLRQRPWLAGSPEVQKTSRRRSASPPETAHRRPRFMGVPVRSNLPSYASLRPTVSTRVPMQQRMQRAFVYLQIPISLELDQVLSHAAQVTDQPGFQKNWVPPVHWLLRHRHHISLTRPFSVPQAEEVGLQRLIETLAEQLDVPELQLEGFDHFFDDWKHVAYVAASVGPSTRVQLTKMAQTVHSEIAKLLSITPEPYYRDNRFHISFLAAMLRSRSLVDNGSTNGETPFDRSLHHLSNADLLLRRGVKLDTTHGIYHGTMPPLPGVSHDQPTQVAHEAEMRAGQALRAVPPVRPTALCLRLGRQFFSFTLKKPDAESRVAVFALQPWPTL